MSIFTKIFIKSHYNKAELLISELLSAGGGSEPTQEEYDRVYPMIIQESRNYFSMINLMLKHINKLDNTIKFHRAMFFIHYILTKLHADREDAMLNGKSSYIEDGNDLSIPLQEQEVDGNIPLPPRIAFLDCYLQILECRLTIESAAYWAGRVEKKYDQKVGRVGGGGNSRNQSVNSNNNNNNSDSTTQSALFTNSSSYSAGSLDTADLEGDDVESQNALLATKQQNYNTASTTTKPGAEQSHYIMPPGGFIEGVYNLYTTSNISILQGTSRLLKLLDVLSLTKAPSDETNNTNSLVNEHIVEPENPPARPAGPPPSLKKKNATAAATTTDKKDDMPPDYSPPAPKLPPPSINKNRTATTDQPQTYAQNDIVQQNNDELFIVPQKGDSGSKRKW